MTDPQCPNCPMYSWKRDADVNSSRCSNCKYLSYCSPECQREHWVKVHKAQCNLLAGKVIVSHPSNSCPRCKEVKELGIETIDSRDSPVLGCIWAQTKWTVRGNWTSRKYISAMEFWEKTRKFPNRTVHTTYVMAHIVRKLIKTEIQLFKKCKTEVDKLWKLLNEAKTRIDLACHRIPELYWDTFPNAGVDWAKGFEKANVAAITACSRKLGTNAGDLFSAWDTFQLLAGFVLYASTDDNKHQYFERFNVREDLTEEEQKLVDKLGPYGQFEEMWDRVLAAVEFRLVHHSDLLDMFCGGTRNQECAQCLTPIIIEGVFNCDIEKPAIVFKKPFVTFRLRIFSCPEINCQVLSRNEEQSFLNESHLVLQKTVLAAGNLNSCDYCSMMSRKMHRCSGCKTKVYCSPECQESDWKLVHSKICNKGDVARKVKGGRKERERTGKENLEKLAKKLAETSLQID